MVGQKANAKEEQVGFRMNMWKDVSVFLQARLLKSFRVCSLHFGSLAYILTNVFVCIFLPINIKR